MLVDELELVDLDEPVILGQGCPGEKVVALELVVDVDAELVTRAKVGVAAKRLTAAIRTIAGTSAIPLLPIPMLMVVLCLHLLEQRRHEDNRELGIIVAYERGMPQLPSMCLSALNGLPVRRL